MHSEDNNVYFYYQELSGNTETVSSYARFERNDLLSRKAIER